MKLMLIIIVKLTQDQLCVYEFLLQHLAELSLLDGIEKSHLVCLSNTSQLLSYRAGDYKNTYQHLLKGVPKIGDVYENITEIISLPR